MERLASCPNPDPLLLALELFQVLTRFLKRLIDLLRVVLVLLDLLQGALKLLDGLSHVSHSFLPWVLGGGFIPSKGLTCKRGSMDVSRETSREVEINHLIGFPSEIQAQQLLEPYGYAHIVTPRPPGQSWDDYAWNGSNGMIGGCKIVHHWQDEVVTGINGVQMIVRAPVPTDSWFWVSLLNPATDAKLWARFSGQPIIELDLTRQPGPIERPSDYVSRSAHLSFDIDAITGPITPIWAGQHTMGFRGDVQP